MTGLSYKTSPSANDFPSSDDSAVSTSNVWTRGPDITSLPDDDPLGSSSHTSRLPTGRALMGTYDSTGARQRRWKRAYEIPENTLDESPADMPYEASGVGSHSDETSVDLLDLERDWADFADDTKRISMTALTFTPSSDAYVDDDDQSPTRLTHDPDAVRAQIDTGAFASCTDRLGCLHDYVAFTEDCPGSVVLHPAKAGSDPFPHGFGYLYVPSTCTPQGHIPVRAYYDSDPRSEIIDGRDFAGTQQRDFRSAHFDKNRTQASWTHRWHLDDNDHQESDDATLREQLQSLSRKRHSLPFYEHFQNNTLKAATERILWHQCLGHPSERYLYHADTYVNGVPRFRHHDPVLGKCPACMHAKQVKHPARLNTTEVAMENYQGLSIDVAFSGTRSKDTARTADYFCLNAETCYLLVVDHKSSCYHGDTHVSKASLLHWSENVLNVRSPACSDKYVFFDQGGKPYSYPKVRRLFERHGYAIRPPGAGASNQNGPVQRSHLNVGYAVRSMLRGEGFPVKFWPHAFHHRLRITDSMPSCGHDVSPLALTIGNRDDFWVFRTWCYRVLVCPTTYRAATLLTNSRQGIFSEFHPYISQNIVWHGVERQLVEVAKYAEFDDSQKALRIDQIQLNVPYLLRARKGGEPLVAAPSGAEFHFLANPFARIPPKQLRVRCGNAGCHTSIATDDLFHRAYVRERKRNGSFSTSKAATTKILGVYDIAIDAENVSVRGDVHRIFQQLRDANVKDLTIEVAPKRAMHTLRLRQALVEHQIFRPNIPDEDNAIRAITAVSHAQLEFPPLSVPLEELYLSLHAVSSHETTAEALALDTSPRTKLQTLRTWEEWRAGEHQQLDQFAVLGLYGDPCVASTGAAILRLRWESPFARDGTCLSRHCCDELRQAAPTLHPLAFTSSSCNEQQIQRLFYALAANCNYKIYGDLQDTVAHPLASEIPTYVSVDDANALERYEAHHEFNVECSGEHTDAILSRPELRFELTTAATMLSFTTLRHEKVLLRHVDDCSLACGYVSVAQETYDFLRRQHQSSKGSEPLQYLGLAEHFPAFDVEPSSRYIALFCLAYLSCMLRAHWSTPSPWLTDGSRQASPLPTDAVDTACDCPLISMEGTVTYRQFPERTGFRYRILFGELRHAYVTRRPAIGHAITILFSRLAARPSDLLSGYSGKFIRYLGRAMNWKISRPWARSAICLATTDFAPLPPDSELRIVRAVPLELHVTFVDAVSPTDNRNRCSTTGTVPSCAVCTRGPDVTTLPDDDPLGASPRTHRLPTGRALLGAYISPRARQHRWNHTSQVASYSDGFSVDPQDLERDCADLAKCGRAVSINALTFTPSSDVYIDDDAQSLTSSALHTISSHGLTAEELALGTFTPKKQEQLRICEAWRAGEHKQLNQIATHGMYRDPHVVLTRAVFLGRYWQYQFKRDCACRSRAGCARLRQAAPMSHAMAFTYSSCTEQPTQRVFYALAANCAYKIDGDAQDTFTHSPGPQVPISVPIADADDGDWYNSHREVDTDRSLKHTDAILSCDMYTRGPDITTLPDDDPLGASLRTQELGFPQTMQAPIYKHTMSTLNMMNSRTPTARSRQIAIRYFTIKTGEMPGT